MARKLLRKLQAKAPQTPTQLREEFDEQQHQRELEFNTRMIKIEHSTRTPANRRIARRGTSSVRQRRVIKGIDFQRPSDVINRSPDRSKERRFPENDATAEPDISLTESDLPERSTERCRVDGWLSEMSSQTKERRIPGNPDVTTESDLPASADTLIGGVIDIIEEHNEEPDTDHKYDTDHEQRYQQEQEQYHHRHRDHHQEKRHWARQPPAFSPAKDVQDPDGSEAVRKYVYAFITYIRAHNLSHLLPRSHEHYCAPRQLTSYAHDPDLCMVQELCRHAGVYRTFIAECHQLSKAIEILSDMVDPITLQSKQA